MTCNLQRHSRAHWEKNTSTSCVCEDPVFIFVQAWVSVFTSPDVCSLVSYRLFLFPSACSFFIILALSLCFLSHSMLLFVIQFELVPKVCKLSQKDHPDVIMPASSRFPASTFCAHVCVLVDKRFKSRQ